MTRREEWSPSSRTKISNCMLKTQARIRSVVRIRYRASKTYLFFASVVVLASVGECGVGQLFVLKV
jgi:hypothetical protein